MQRRGVLKLGAAGAAVFAVAGGAAVLWRPRSWKEGRFHVQAQAVLRSISEAMLDGTLPEAADARQRSLVSNVDRLESLVAGLPVATQAELEQLLSVVVTAPGRLLLTGLSNDWSRATVQEVQSALDAMRTSRISMRRQAYHALRDLVRAAWFADEAHWPAIGYPGPRPV